MSLIFNLVVAQTFEFLGIELEVSGNLYLWSRSVTAGVRHPGNEVIVDYWADSSATWLPFIKCWGTSVCLK